MSDEGDEGESILSDEDRMSILSQVFTKGKVNESASKPAPKEEPISHSEFLSTAPKKFIEASSGSSPQSPTPNIQTPKVSEELSPSKETFGSLLEKTLSQRQNMEEEETILTDEVRDKVLNEAKKEIHLVDDLCKMFFR